MFVGITLVNEPLCLSFSLFANKNKFVVVDTCSSTHANRTEVKTSTGNMATNYKHKSQLFRRCTPRVAQSMAGEVSTAASRVFDTHVVTVAVWTDLCLVDQRRFDLRQVSLFFGLTDLREDLLLLRIPFVFERDHFVGGAELRVPAASSARQLRHFSGERKSSSP